MNLTSINRILIYKIFNTGKEETEINSQRSFARDNPIQLDKNH